MKKQITVITLFLIFVVQVSYCQIEKKTLLLGGSVSFDSYESGTIFNFNPNVGYFFADRFAVGINPSIAKSPNTTFILIGPFMRYYVSKTEKGGVFAQLSTSYNSLKVDNISDSYIGFGGKVGYSVFLNNSVALEIAGGYNKLNDSNRVFGLSVGFQIHFKN